MISDLLKIIDTLQTELFCYLEEGSLKNRLVESYLDEEDAHAEILEFEHNCSLRITPSTAATAPTFECHLEAGEFQYQIIFAAEDFTDDERAELIELLKPHRSVSGRYATSPSKNIVRKKQASGLLGISAAAKVLGLSHRSLKSLIPCSETRITEQNGTKSIKEYYWDQQLIDRFESLWQKQQQGRGYNSEDLTFIAASCCDGDRQWAKDCINGFLDQRKLLARPVKTDA